MSVRRYKDICALIQRTTSDPEEAQQILAEFHTIMNLTEEKINSYHENLAESVKRYRNRKKEQGISTYITSGRKQQYEREKAIKHLHQHHPESVAAL